MRSLAEHLGVKPMALYHYVANKSEIIDAVPGPGVLIEAYPSLLEFSTEHIMKPDEDFGREFQFGLDLILDGLTRSELTHRPDQTEYDGGNVTPQNEE